MLLFITFIVISILFIIPKYNLEKEIEECKKLSETQLERAGHDSFVIISPRDNCFVDLASEYPFFEVCNEIKNISTISNNYESCINNIAIKKLDIGLCRNKSCINTIAIKTLDSRLCQSNTWGYGNCIALSSNYDRNSCKKLVSNYSQQKDCLDIILIKEFEDKKNIKYSSGVNLFNVSFCEQLPTKDKQEYCYFLARACDKTSGRIGIPECYHDKAIEENNKSLCSFVPLYLPEWLHKNRSTCLKYFEK